MYCTYQEQVWLTSVNFSVNCSPAHIPYLVAVMNSRDTRKHKWSDWHRCIHSVRHHEIVNAACTMQPVIFENTNKFSILNWNTAYWYWYRDRDSSCCIHTCVKWRLAQIHVNTDVHSDLTSKTCCLFDFFTPPLPVWLVKALVYYCTLFTCPHCHFTLLLLSNSVYTLLSKYLGACDFFSVY